MQEEGRDAGDRKGPKWRKIQVVLWVIGMQKKGGMRREGGGNAGDKKKAKSKKNAKSRKKGEKRMGCKGMEGCNRGIMHRRRSRGDAEEEQ